MTASAMCVPNTKQILNVCRLRVKMARISRSLRTLHAFFFAERRASAAFYLLFACALQRSLPLASGESSQASCEDIFRTTCRENPDPNAASGRKKGGIPSKNYEICLRLSEAQAQKLRQNAKACGLSKTAYLRRLIEGAELKARPSQELRQLRTEIHHIGNNVNQLARKFNAGFGNKGDAQQVRYLMEQIYDLLYEIAKE